MVYFVRTDRTIDKVDSTMADIQEQTQLANEVSEAISTSAYNGVELDDVRPLSHSPRARTDVYLTITYRRSCGKSSRRWKTRPSTSASARPSTYRYTTPQAQRVSPVLCLPLCMPMY